MVLLLLEPSLPFEHEERFATSQVVSARVRQMLFLFENCKKIAIRVSMSGPQTKAILNQGRLQHIAHALSFMTLSSSTSPISGLSYGFGILRTNCFGS